MKLFDIIFESVVDMYEVTPIKWTEDAIRREAIKYNSKVEFANGNQSAYNASRKLGILDDLGFVNKYNYWDEDAIRREAKKYNSKVEFQKGSPTAYKAALRLGIIDKPGSVKKDGLGFVNKLKYWDEDAIRREATKYNTKIEFVKGNPSAYNASRKLGILDDLGFKVVGSLYKRMIYAFIFKENNAVYVGLTYNSDKRYKQHLRIDTNGGKTSPVKLFMDKTGETPEMIKLTDYLPKEEAIVKEKEYEKYYKDLGYNILNIAKAGSLGGSLIKWTEDAIRREAKKYNSKAEFAIGNPSAYGRARMLGIINDLGFVNKRKSWDEDSIRREAKKYNTKVEFEKGNQKAYRAALLRGILDDLGLVNTRKSWDKESIRQEAIKYNTKAEFQRGTLSAYRAALRLGLLNMLFPKK
jgi:predicted GIY-YIG superfamily endonuclease